MGKEVYTQAGFAELCQTFIDEYRNRSSTGKKELELIKNHVNYLVDLLPQDQLSYKTFAIGFMASAGLYPFKTIDAYVLLGIECFLALHQRGFEILPEDLPDFMENEDFPSSDLLLDMLEIRKVLSIDEAVAERKKEQEKSIGLVHGHFRLITPNHLVFLILASKESDVLFMGVEKGDRTKEYKKKNILLTDQEREELFSLVLKNLEIVPFWIDDSVEYSDDGYQRLVELFNPNAYISPRMNSEEKKAVMKNRADRLENTRYVELPLIDSLHTSEIEELILGVSGEKLIYPIFLHSSSRS